MMVLLEHQGARRRLRGWDRSSSRRALEAVRGSLGTVCNIGMDRRGKEVQDREASEEGRAGER